MNELPVIGSLRFRKDFWDRHGANITTVRGPKKTIMERDHGFFVAVLSELDCVMSIQGKRDFCVNNHEIWGKMHLLTFHHAQGLLRNWHLVLVSKFKHISYKSLKPNNSIKPFQFCLRVLSLLLVSCFFLGVVIQKSATTATSKQQEIEMVCLGIEYYRNALKWLNTYTASLPPSLLRECVGTNGSLKERCTSECMPKVPAGLSVICPSPPRSSRRKWRHKNLGIVLKQTITRPRDFLVFFIAYFILPKSNIPKKQFPSPLTTTSLL